MAVWRQRKMTVLLPVSKILIEKINNEGENRRQKTQKKKKNETSDLFLKKVAMKRAKEKWDNESNISY